MENDMIKLELASGGMRQMAEIMAPGTQVYREKMEECEELRSLLVKSEARVAFLEEELSKERQEKERWKNDSLLYRDMATRREAMLQLIILNAKRLKTVMSKITEFSYVGVMRSVLRDALDDPQDMEQQRLLDSTMAFPDPQRIEVKNEFADGSCRFEMGSSLNGDVIMTQNNE